MREKVFALKKGDCWCSPLVGFFEPGSGNDLGTIKQLGRCYDIVCDAQGGTLVRENARPVAYGDILAHQVEVSPDLAVEQENGVSPIIDTRATHIVAQYGGFVTLTVSRGDVVNPGDVVAVIEMMKLGIDVVYDGQRSACVIDVFGETTIHAGDVVCSLALGE